MLGGLPPLWLHHGSGSCAYRPCTKGSYGPKACSRAGTGNRTTAQLQGLWPSVLGQPQMWFLLWLYPCSTHPLRCHRAVWAEEAALCAFEIVHPPRTATTLFSFLFLPHSFLTHLRTHLHVKCRVGWAASTGKAGITHLGAARMERMGEERGDEGLATSSPWGSQPHRGRCCQDVRTFPSHKEGFFSKKITRAQRGSPGRGQRLPGVSLTSALHCCFAALSPPSCICHSLTTKGSCFPRGRVTACPTGPKPIPMLEAGCWAAPGARRD